jgi:hypothetical protein
MKTHFKTAKVAECERSPLCSYYCSPTSRSKLFAFSRSCLHQRGWLQTHLLFPALKARTPLLSLEIAPALAWAPRAERIAPLAELQLSALIITTQLAAASKARYALIVIQVGANDIIRFAAATHSAKQIEPVLFAAAARADSVIFLSAGNVGGAYLLPFLLRPFYHYLTRSHHYAFEAAAARAGVTYVNLYAPPHNDPFTQNPSLFLAEDGLHPSSEGYRLWFDKVAKHL